MAGLESILRDFVLKHLSSEQVSNAIKKSNVPLSSYAGKSSESDILDAAGYFSQLLYSAQQAAYRKEGLSTTNIPYPTIRGLNKDGEALSIRVEYRSDALHRDSWSPNYPDGVTNIMALLNTGYTLTSKVTPYKIAEEKTTVFGKTVAKGHRIYARRHRDAMGFIEAAIDQFNASKYGNKFVITPDASFGG